MITPDVQPTGLPDITAAPSLDEALARAGRVVVQALREAMKSAGISKIEQSLAALETTQLDRLLARSLAEGAVDHRVVRRELDRLMRALSTRTLAAADLKAGILAFDEAAQRIALAAGRGTAFKYPTVGNRARDSLITFARSLHR